MTPADAVTGPKNGVLPDVPAWVQDSALLDAIAAAVVATDTAGTIFYFNAAAEQLYGHPREAMLGANVMKLLVEPVDAVPAGRIMATVLAGERWSGQFRVRRHSGSTLVVRITATPVMEQGQVVGVIGVGPAACRADAPRYGDLCRDRAGQGHVDRCPRVPTRSSVSDAVGVLATHQPQAS